MTFTRKHVSWTNGPHGHQDHVVSARSLLASGSNTYCMGDLKINFDTLYQTH